MGASGAGKSTLLYALSGMDTPSLGAITFGDKVISDFRAACAHNNGKVALVKFQIDIFKNVLLLTAV